MVRQSVSLLVTTLLYLVYKKGLRNIKSLKYHENQLLVIEKKVGKVCFLSFTYYCSLFQWKLSDKVCMYVCVVCVCVCVCVVCVESACIICMGRYYLVSPQCSSAYTCTATSLPQAVPSY